MDEYWADDGEAPEWRLNLRIGTPLNKLCFNKPAKNGKNDNAMLTLPNSYITISLRILFMRVVLKQYLHVIFRYNVTSYFY